jgi:hypothetical protein
VLATQEPVVVQQQQQRQQLCRPLADLAGFWDNPDPTDPFTLYGSNL